MYADPKQLERVAIELAREAVDLDVKGIRSLAISKYQQCIHHLTKLVRDYPDHPLKSLYMRKIREYKERVAYLRGMVANDARTYTGPVDADVKPAQYEHVVAENPKVAITWDDVVGLEHVKKAIRQAIVYPSLRPDLFPLGWPTGILLFGPPGCGKTTVAAAASNEINGHFIAVDAASIMSKWLGEAEKNVAALFRKARSLSGETRKPVVLFIDEVDSLFGVREHEVGGEVRVRNQFLKEMDGIQNKNRNSMVYVIASTNRPWALAWGFIRRFQKRLYVPMPDLDMRAELFQYFISKLGGASDVDFRKLAAETEGYTASDIRDICQTAHIEVVTELFESGRALNPGSRPRPITQRDLENAIRRTRPSVSPEMIKVYDAWGRKFSAC